MYIVDFFKGLVRKSNIPTIIYLILNIIIIDFIIAFFFSLSAGEAFLWGLLLYVVSLTVALSPVGEWILRLQTGCKKLKNQEQIDRLQPLFYEIYNSAKKKKPNLPDDIQLYINASKEANAFATGRKTICVTEGLLFLSDEEIKAVLAHEFGHIVHKDTDVILVITVGNMFVSIVITIIQLLLIAIRLLGMIISFFSSGDGIIAGFLMNLSGLLMMIMVNGGMWLWTKLGVLLVMKSSRDNEYEADEFAFHLGYGDYLCEALGNICGEEEHGLFASLASSHPEKSARIRKLQNLKMS